jgi:hypothetical protein
MLLHLTLTYLYFFCAYICFFPLLGYLLGKDHFFHTHFTLWWPMKETGFQPVLYPCDAELLLLSHDGEPRRASLLDVPLSHVDAEARAGHDAEVEARGATALLLLSHNGGRLTDAELGATEGGSSVLNLEAAGAAGAAVELKATTPLPHRRRHWERWMHTPNLLPTTRSTSAAVVEDLTLLCALSLSFIEAMAEEQ